MSLADEIRGLDNLRGERILTVAEFDLALDKVLQPDRSEDPMVRTIIQKAESRVNALEKTKEDCKTSIALLEEYSFATEERRLVIRDLLRSQKVVVDTDGESKLAELKKEKDDITGLLVSAQNTYSVVLRQASECRGSSGRAPRYDVLLCVP
eukprot:Rhum_TRINITY_DN13511_c0_g1::Rhum_TRINITY_DN13511_c0_g1_i3::g.60783::m.60783